MKILRLAIISTHPIQYYAPIFQALALSGAVQPKVFFTWSQTEAAGVADPGFAKVISWDIPLLEGYEFEFVPNIARRPGTGHFHGLRNPDLNGAIERWQADAVLVFGWNGHSHLSALRYFKGRTPVFFRGDSTLLNPTSLVRALARRTFLRWIYKHVDVAIAVGSNNRDYYRWCGMPQERIAIAPHAIDTRRFADGDGSHDERALQWRSELGISPLERVILFAGKMIPVKDPMSLLEAFIASEAPGRLVFVGNGVLEPDLRQRAQGRTDIHFLPFQNQLAMPAVYRLGDLFVLPSRSETWGLAVNEAMASGRVVIASSRVGGARDLVTPDHTGWVYESGSREQLTSIVKRGLTCAPRVLRDMGAAARRESERWSIDEAARGIERAVLGFCSPSHRAQT